MVFAVAIDLVTSNNVEVYLNALGDTINLNYGNLQKLRFLSFGILNFEIQYEITTGYFV